MEGRYCAESGDGCGGRDIQCAPSSHQKLRRLRGVDGYKTLSYWAHHSPAARTESSTIRGRHNRDLPTNVLEDSPSADCSFRNPFSHPYVQLIFSSLAAPSNHGYP